MSSGSWQSATSSRAISRSFLADLWSYAPGRTVLLLVLTLLLGLTESIGLILLVPLLTLTGELGGDSSPVADRIGNLLGSIGIPLTLSWVLVVLVGIVSIRAIVGYWRTITAAQVRLGFVDHLRLRLFDAVANAGWIFHLKQRASDLSHVITVDLNRVGGGTFIVFDALTRIALTVGYTVIAFQLSPLIAGVALVMAAALGALAWPHVGRSKALGALQTERGKRSFGSQSELLAGLKLAKSHGLERHHVKAHETDVTRLREAAEGFEKVSARTNALIQIGTVAAIAALMWLGVEVVELPAAELLVLALVLSRMTGALATILNRIQAAVNMLPAYDSAQKLLAEAQTNAESTDSTHKLSVAINEGIELRDVGFSYVEGTQSLSEISISIPAHQTTAIVGPSGAGKTTLVDIILGLVEPDTGMVLVDEVALSDVGLAAWRKNLAYVQQEPFLFHETLRQNLDWAAGQALGPDEMDAIVQTAALGPLVAGLPAGVDTVVGDRGHRLSGGERQRVALARALARRPELLVLDEATSALDRENEQAIQNSIERLHGDLTIVVIAHRLETIRNADQIVVLDQGRVIEVGTWESLAESHGRLAQMITD